MGLSEAVNYGIFKAVRNKVLNNVSLLVNLEHTSHGFHLIHKMDVCIGLHANISVGIPLTELNRIPSLVNHNQFKKSSVYRNADEDIVDLDEAILEIENQLKHFKKEFKRIPDYIDFHAVPSAQFIRATKIVAKRHRLPFIGVNLDGTPAEVEGKQMRFQVSSGENVENLVTTFKKMLENSTEDIIDLMVYHPGFIDIDLIDKSSLVQQRIYDAAFLASSDLREYVTKENIKLVQLNHLRNV